MGELDAQDKAKAQRLYEERLQARKGLGKELGSAFASYVQALTPEEKAVAEGTLADQVALGLKSSRGFENRRAAKALIRLAERVPSHHHTEPRIK